MWYVLISKYLKIDNLITATQNWQIDELCVYFVFENGKNGGFLSDFLYFWKKFDCVGAKLRF